MAEVLFSFDVCLCVCLPCVSVRSGPVSQTSLKLYGLQIWHACFQGQSGHDSLKIFRKEAWPGSRDPINFWALNANSSKTVKAAEFKFDKRVPRDSPDMTP